MCSNHLFCLRSKVLHKLHFHMFRKSVITHIFYPWCFLHVIPTPHCDGLFWFQVFGDNTQKSVISLHVYKMINRHTLIVICLSIFFNQSNSQGGVGGSSHLKTEMTLPSSSSMMLVYHLLNVNTTSKISSAQWTGLHRWSLLFEPVTTCHLPFDLCSKPTPKLSSVNIGHALHPRNTGASL